MAERRACAIHARVLKLDSHVDFSPSAITGPAPDHVSGIPRNQVNLPKLDHGGLDAVFFSIHTGQRQDFSDSGYARARAEDIAKQVVAEANRLGIMLDISHPPKVSNLQVLALNRWRAWWRRWRRH